MAESESVDNSNIFNSYWESRGLIVAGLFISYIIPFPFNIIILLGDLFVTNPKIPASRLILQTLFTEDEEDTDEDYTVRQFISVLLSKLRSLDKQTIIDFMTKPIGKNNEGTKKKE